MRIDVGRLSGISLVALVLVLDSFKVYSQQALVEEGAQQGASHSSHVQNSQGAHGEHSRRRPQVWDISYLNGANVTMWRADLTVESLQPTDGQVTIPRTGLGGFHVFLAEAEKPSKTVAAIRYHYANGKPVDARPRDLIAINKTDLEVVPDPLPREHYRYYGNERWAFLVRYHGELVPELDVTLQTSNGTRLTEKTDKSGRVRFILPDDFTDVKPGIRANPPGSFSVSTNYSVDGHHHETRLESKYYPNPSHWRSTSLGFWVMGGGFLMGLATLRGGRKKKERKV